MIEPEAEKSKLKGCELGGCPRMAIFRPASAGRQAHPAFLDLAKNFSFSDCLQGFMSQRRAKKVNINFKHFSGLSGLGLGKIWDRLLEKISMIQAALS